MSTIAKLFIDGSGLFGQGINIIQCNFSFNQSYDSTMKPVGRPTGGQIHIVMDSMFDKESEFFAWMIREKELRNGRIELYRQEVDQSGVAISNTQQIRTLSFTSAACISYDESFSIHSDSTIRVTLIAKAIKLGSYEHTNLWPDKV